MHKLRLTALVMFCGIPLASLAHHTYAEYDQQKTVEIEGVLIKAAWQNPHLSLKVQGVDAGRHPITWNIEGSSVNALARLGVPLEDFKVGTRVKAAGWPSKRAADRLFLTNLLSQSGRELVAWRYSQPRWTKAAAGYGATSTYFEGGTPSSSASLFRVWSAQFGVAGAAFDQSVSARADGSGPPLTAKAKKLAAAAKTASTTLDGCVKKGMPSIMLTPTPIEFVDKGDIINVRVEFNDTVRTIHMRAGTNNPPQARTPLGYSTGRWDGKTLVVETTQVDWPWFNFGIPQSAAVRFVERFTPSTDGSRLDYALTSIDPEMLAKPLEQKSAWVWHPNEKLLAYNCVSDYQK
jgi:uncharacterized protein DUF6152